MDCFYVMCRVKTDRLSRSRIGTELLTDHQAAPNHSGTR